MNKKDVLFHYMSAQQPLNKVAEMTRVHEEAGGYRVVLHFNREADNDALVSFLKEGVDEMHFYKINGMNSGDYLLVGMNEDDDLICLEETEVNWQQREKAMHRNLQNFTFEEDGEERRVKLL